MRWWDQECEEAIDLRKQALKEYKRQKNTDAFIEYKRTRARARKIINTKKRENFDKFCAEINRQTSLTYVWTTMKMFKNVKKNINWNR